MNPILKIKTHPDRFLSYSCDRLMIFQCRKEALHKHEALSFFYITFQWFVAISGTFKTTWQHYFEFFFLQLIRFDFQFLHSFMVSVTKKDIYTTSVNSLKIVHILHECKIVGSKNFNQAEILCTVPSSQVWNVWSP